MNDPRWCPGLAAEVAAHAAIGLQPRQLWPQVEGLLQDASHYLRREPRIYTYAVAFLREAQQAATGRHGGGYRQARRVATRQESYAPARRAAQRRCRARWQTADVTSAVAVCIWVIRRYIAIVARRYGAVESPHTAGFIHGHQAQVASMARELQRWERPGGSRAS